MRPIVFLFFVFWKKKITNKRDNDNIFFPYGEV